MKCPYLHRCNKYTDLTCQIDRLREVLLAKDREIARLKAENEKLKARQCGGKADPAKTRLFGSSTPSSLIPIKENSTEEARRRIGGRPKGHVGCGRKDIPSPDERIDLPYPVCPINHAELTHFQVRTRTVVHSVPARCITRQYTIYRAWCPVCSTSSARRQSNMPMRRRGHAMAEAATHGASSLRRPRSTASASHGVRQSRRIRDEILTWIAKPVKDGKLRGFFELMNKKRHRFFQWVDHPEVEAENNLAERRLRPLVVARKVCFGSQS